MRLLLPLIVIAGLANARAQTFPVETELVRGGDAPLPLDVDVTGLDDLYLVVTYGKDSYSSDQAIWAQPTLTTSDGTVVDLTTLAPQRAEVGWGQLVVGRNQNGGRLAIGRKTFDSGFWAHGPSVLHFKLGGKYARLRTVVGIDRGAGRKGSVRFIVTDKVPEMPPRRAFTGRRTKRAPPALPKPPSAATSSHRLHPEAAATLLERGIERLLFIRRYTLNANHVYTEYLNSRWTPGGGLTLLDLTTGEVRDVLPQLTDGVVNRFDVSFDGKKVLFDYKKGPRDGYRIFEVNVDGTGLRQLTFPEDDEAKLVERYGSGGYHHGTDDMHPCYLPDGGIAFVTTRCQYGILCNAADVYTTKNLYRMDADGGRMRPLSNSPVSEASPAMLPDGRIVYHRWEYVDKAAGNVKSLWSIYPDGSASSEIYGNAITFPETMIYPRPIPGAHGKIVMLGTSHCCPNNAMGAVIVVDTSKEMRSPEAMTFVTDDIRALAHTGFHFRDKNGAWKLDKTGSHGRLFKDPYPVSEDLFIAAKKPKGPTWDDPRAYDLCLLDGEGNATPLYEDGDISCWHPYALEPRERPPVLVSPKDERLAQAGRALCVVTDVYAGMDGVDRGAVKYLRILEEVPRPWAVRKPWHPDDRDGMAHSAIGDGFLGLKVQHGVVPVEADGSAHFYVPALRNIYFQALDDRFLAIQTERTHVQYMPGERRSCIGCHETANQTQTSSTGNPIALARPASVPAPQPDERRAQKLFDYDRDIQPIWNRRCLPCHGTDERAGGLSLDGRHVGVYSSSYANLIKLSKGKRRLLGHRAPRNENVGSAETGFLPPYALGARTSPLAAMLTRGRIRMRDPEAQTYAKRLIESHEDLVLSEAEILRITNWLDINCQYHRSYWGRLHAKHRDHPNYRPEVTFDEALLRQVPESVASAEGEATSARVQSARTRSSTLRR